MSAPRLFVRPGPMANLLIRGVYVLDPRVGLDERRDVLIREGRIAELGAPDSLPADDVDTVEATGKHLFPGFVDPHVHLRTPGQEYKENLDTGTAAAAAGGYCAVIAMPNTSPTVDNAAVLGSLIQRAGNEARVPVGFLASITRGLEGRELTEMADLRDTGGLGFTDDGRPVVSAGILRRALQYQRLCGGVIALHEEDPELSGDGVMHEGAVSARLGMAGIPSLSESTMVARDGALAVYEDARVHFQHLSCVESVQALAAAKQAGARVSGEVCPHHLTLTDDMVRTLDSRFKMNPPLRSEPDRRALVEGLRSGVIDCVATDHAPHARHEKEVPFEEAPMGTTGSRDGVRRPVHRAGHVGRARARDGDRADDRRRGAVRPGGAADRGRRARQPVPGRPRRSLPGRRGRLRQPLGQLLLPRPDAARPRGHHHRRRADRLPAPDAGHARSRARRPTRRGPQPPMSSRSATAYVLLEDGMRFDGLACGADAPAVGEIVFTTSMSGYQEAMTDPSYAGQLIAFTYPQVGNYGVSAEAMESDRVHARAAIMRAGVDRDDAPGAETGWLAWLTEGGIPAITDVDTRALVRHIRDAGAMRGGVFPARIEAGQARELIAAEPAMAGRDLARDVSPAETIVLPRATAPAPDRGSP